MDDDIDLIAEVTALLTESSLDIKTIDVDNSQVIVKLEDGKCYSLTVEEINGQQKTDT